MTECFQGVARKFDGSRKLNEYFALLYGESTKFGHSVYRVKFAKGGKLSKPALNIID